MGFGRSRRLGSDQLGRPDGLCLDPLDWIPARAAVRAAALADAGGASRGRAFVRDLPCHDLRAVAEVGLLGGRRELRLRSGGAELPLRIQQGLDGIRDARLRLRAVRAADAAGDWSAGTRRGDVRNQGWRANPTRTGA